MGNLLANYFYQTNDHGPAEEPRAPPRPTSSSELESMCRRVKEVLPQVPTDIIARDLRITSDVDESITRLLDGTVKYTPETSSGPSNPLNTSSVMQSMSKASDNRKLPLTDAPSLSTAASSFGNNSSERMKSLEERKKMLIEASKARYLVNHPTN